MKSPEIVNNFLEESLSMPGIHAKKKLVIVRNPCEKYSLTRDGEAESECKTVRFGFVRSMKKMYASSGEVRGSFLSGIDFGRGRQGAHELFPNCHARPAPYVYDTTGKRNYA